MAVFFYRGPAMKVRCTRTVFGSSHQAGFSVSLFFSPSSFSSFLSSFQLSVFLSVLSSFVSSALKFFLRFLKKAYACFTEAGAWSFIERYKTLIEQMAVSHRCFLMWLANLVASCLDALQQQVAGGYIMFLFLESIAPQTCQTPCPFFSRLEEDRKGSRQSENADCLPSIFLK